MNSNTDIRVFNNETKEMDYFYDARIHNTDGINRVFSCQMPNGQTKWVKIGDAMQKTVYDIANEPIYEKDVIVYMGEPCMVFIDHESHDAAVFYGNEKVFLKDIIEDSELLTNVYDDNKYANIAMTNFKNNYFKAYTSAEILVVGFQNKEEQIGALMIKTTDGLALNKRYKFMNVPRGYAELYSIMDSLIEIKLKGSKADIVTIKCSNDFTANMLNNIGIVLSWRKNGWKTKSGKPVQNSSMWNKVLDAMHGLTVKAELMTDEEKQRMFDYIRS